MTNASMYSRMFDYLSASNIPTSPESGLAFGRSDPLVARAIGELATEELIPQVVITGGIGKDSGDILKQGFRSEAAFLGHALEIDAAARGYDLPEVILEERAMNGRENVVFGLRILQLHGYPTDPITVIAHATSAARLAATLRHELGLQSPTRPLVHVKPTNYHFEPENPKDQHEATKEILRLVHWPKEGYLDETNVPAEFVDFAQDTGLKTPLYPTSRLINGLFRMLPPSLRIIALQSIN